MAHSPNTTRGSDSQPRAPGRPRRELKRRPFRGFLPPGWSAGPAGFAASAWPALFCLLLPACRQIPDPWSRESGTRARLRVDCWCCGLCSTHAVVRTHNAGTAARRRRRQPRRGSITTSAQTRQRCGGFEAAQNGGLVANWAAASAAAAGIRCRRAWGRSCAAMLRCAARGTVRGVASCACGPVRPASEQEHGHTVRNCQDPSAPPSVERG